MFWADKKPEKPFEVPDDVVDLSFKLNCKHLPLDHAHSLSKAILEVIPWLKDEPNAGLHLIHGAGSSNGWMRPENPETELLHLSHRTRMSLRLPKHRLTDAQTLCGKTLDIEGHSLEIGDTKIKMLSKLDTIFTRYLVADPAQSEEDFVHSVIDTLQAIDIPVHKIMCGLGAKHRTPDGLLHTRSIMLAELSPSDSVKLQQQGLGPHREMGCGLFIPHKGIAAVKQASEKD